MISEAMQRLSIWLWAIAAACMAMPATTASLEIPDWRDRAQLWSSGFAIVMCTVMFTRALVMARKRHARELPVEEMPPEA